MNVERVEEALGIIWNLREHNIYDERSIAEKLEKGVSENIFEVLKDQEFIVLREGEVALTAKGEKIAVNISRRHRLAERLLADVLAIGTNRVDYDACKLEHVLSKEVEESICALLGHPKECPHGSKIPPGECCRKTEKSIERIVTTLDRLEVGKEAKVAYILSKDDHLMHKLMSLGVSPGVRIRVHQTFPAFVIQVDEMQFALEKEVASQIYVRNV